MPYKDREAGLANQRLRNRRFRERHLEQEIERQKDYRATPRGRELHCIQEMDARLKNPERYLWRAAKQRAQKFNVPFTIQPSDIVIPEICPVLGIPLKIRIGHGRPMDDSPSLDRLIPKLGYTPENVCVISNRANALKKNSTVEELEALLRWVRSRICK
jgi:hypothetical protein